METIKNLHLECDWLVKNYDIRKEARDGDHGDHQEPPPGVRLAGQELRHPEGGPRWRPWRPSRTSTWSATGWSRITTSGRRPAMATMETIKNLHLECDWLVKNYDI